MNEPQDLGPKNPASFSWDSGEISPELQGQIENFSAQIAQILGRPATEVAEDTKNAFIEGVVTNLAEAKEMLISGPLVRGFDETNDPNIPNQEIKNFLTSSFGPNISQKVKLGLVGKDDKFLVYRGYSPENYAIFQALTEQGVLHYLKGQFTSRYAENKADYIKAALALERKNNPEELENLYKVRSEAGGRKIMSKIELHSFAVEQTKDYDYLTGLEMSDENKMRAYILGTLAHEVAHRYKRTMDPKLFILYGQIVEEENTNFRDRLVSDYARKHYEIFKSAPDTIIEEDFVETVRIYITNPDFLKAHYPRRLAFIQTYCPEINPGTVLKTIKNINS